MVALEMLGLVGLAAVTIWVARGAAIFFALHVALWLHHRRFERPAIDMVPTRPGQWLPLAEFYEVWPAVAFGATLTASDQKWGWLLLVVALAFRSAVLKQVLDELTLIAEVGGRIAVRAGMLWRATESTLQRAVRWSRDAIVRGWWALYRTHWRVRHWFGPLLLFVRRQGRRFRRIVLRRGSPGSTT
jgi:hypothetical protein